MSVVSLIAIKMFFAVSLLVCFLTPSFIEGKDLVLKLLVFFSSHFSTLFILFRFILSHFRPLFFALALTQKRVNAKVQKQRTSYICEDV